MLFQVCPTVNTDEFERLCGGREYSPKDGFCKKIPKLCMNGVCIDLDGDYRCECKLGFRFNEDLLICEGMFSQPLHYM